MPYQPRRWTDADRPHALLTLCFWPAPCVQVQAQGFTFDQVRLPGGSTQNTVTGIAQSPQGFLWLATHGGLLRYDGYHATTHRNKTIRRTAEPVPSKTDDFHQFEQQGWQRVAGNYDAAWSGLTRPFVPHLLDAVGVTSGTRLLDVACGPGYVAEAAQALGAIPTGLDFSSEMIRLARARNPRITFREGDAQVLDFDDNAFDVVVTNFGLHHLSRPEAAIAEAYRVVRPGGRYGFTVWAAPDMSPGARIVAEAVQAHANLDVSLPEGPDYFAYGNADHCRTILSQVGFDAASLVFRSVTVEWEVPSASFVFESERDAGVRTAALLAVQEPEVLAAIQDQIEASVRAYARGDGFAIPFTAHVVAVSACRRSVL